ncbi:MAG TPA: ATP synthase F1 subunit delta [Candidatus Binatia bacterium]|nr:ATP synthase F1 subunit delta [Candidatus Binatia bacterium]
MSLQSVARRYATALADVLEKGQESVVKEELDAWQRMIGSNPQLREALENPTIPYDQKRQLLLELIRRTRVTPITGNFLQVLLRNQRLAALPQIVDRLSDVLDSRANVVAAHVTTAKPVNEEIKKMLTEKLTDFTGKSVRLTFTVDDSLIGGLVTRIGSTVYDGSIRNQLNQMEKTLAS